VESGDEGEMGLGPAYAAPHLTVSVRHAGLAGPNLRPRLTAIYSPWAGRVSALLAVSLPSCSASGSTVKAGYLLWAEALRTMLGQRPSAFG
jgi:hypothetical protein